MAFAINEPAIKVESTSALRLNIFAQYQRAYQSYRQFKAMTPEQMQDMGITQADVDRAKYRDFLNHSFR